MFDFFGTILGWLQTLANFIVSLVESLILAIVALSASSSLPLTLVSFMPAILGASITIVVAVMVVKFLIGR